MTQSQPTPKAPPQQPIRRKPRPVRYTDWASI